MIDGTKPFMLRCWDDGLWLDMRSFETVPVWVKLFKLHPWFRSNHMLCRIRSMIGNPICMDGVTASKKRTEFLSY